MAAPLVQRVTLDSAAALRELAQLERSLLQLNQPINVPVDVDIAGTRQAETQMGQLRREVDQTGDEFTQMGRKADDSIDGVLRVGTRGASAFTSLRGSILGVGAALAAIQGVRLLGTGFAAAIKEASSFEESLSKTNVVFGSLSGEIQDFAKTAPQALGLSTAAALEATSTFGNLFVALGLSQEAAAAMSPDIVQLASDLASFNNIAVDEAVEKLRSGLVGEVEPLRTLGVSLNAAVVDAKAFELGLVDASGVVTEAGKVQARYALILEQTTTAQGDYARTADGIANTQRTLQAEVKNLSAEFGQALIPAYQALLELAPTVLEAIRDLEPVVANLAQSFADGVPAVSGFAGALQALSAVPSVIGVFKEGSDAVRDFLFGIAQVGTLQFEKGFNQIAEGINSIRTAADNINIDILRNSLVNALQRGVEPADALANALVGLSQVSLDPAAMREEAQALASISGLDFSTLFDLGEFLRQDLTARGLDPSAISALTVGIVTLDQAVATSAQNEIALIRQINAEREKGRPKARQAKTDQIAASREVAAAAAEEAAILERLNQVSEESGQSLFFISQNAGLFGQEVAGLVTQFGAADLEALALAAGFDAIANSLKFDTSDAVEEFDLLINKTNEAGEEVPLSVAEMIADLQAQADALARIELGTVILEALGFDALAREIREKGPAGVEALEGFLADLGAAADAERILDEGGNPGADFVTLVEEAIEAGDITPAMLEYISGLTSEEAQQTVLAAAGIGADAYVNEWQERLNLAHVTLPPGFFLSNFNLLPGGGSLPPTPPVGQGAPGGDMYIYFYDTPAPTTDTVRITQSLQKIRQ